MEFFSPSTMADSFGNVNLGLSSLSFGAENVLLQAPPALGVSFEKPAAVTLMCFPLYVLFFSFSCQYCFFLPCTWCYDTIRRFFSGIAYLVFSVPLLSVQVRLAIVGGSFLLWFCAGAAL